MFEEFSSVWGKGTRSRLPLQKLKQPDTGFPVHWQWEHSPQAELGRLEPLTWITEFGGTLKQQQGVWLSIFHWPHQVHSPPHFVMGSCHTNSFSIDP